MLYIDRCSILTIFCRFSNSIVMSNMTFPLVCSLKSLFALLMYSDLPFVNPEDIFKKSKPSNFIIGTQQDSSEFIW